MHVFWGRGNIRDALSGRFVTGRRITSRRLKLLACWPAGADDDDEVFELSPLSCRRHWRI